jgi:hypothetical protein
MPKEYGAEAQRIGGSDPVAVAAMGISKYTGMERGREEPKRSTTTKHEGGFDSENLPYG